MVVSGMMQMSVFWLIAMVVLLVIEAVVPGLISIWFALGALAALISALFHAPVWLQIIVTEGIDNLHAKGAVLLDGKTWTARMDRETEKAEKGETVRVLRIEGVKLIVEKPN